MEKTRKIYLRGKDPTTVPVDMSKADLARKLLAAGYTVSEISRAVPMAYSQVYSIAQKGGKLKLDDRRPTPLVDAHGPTTQAEADRWAKAGREARIKSAKKTEAPISSYPGGKRPTSKGRVAEAKVWAGKKADEIIGRTNITVSPLRAHGKRALGRCANCGFDLIETVAGKERLIVHTGGDATDYYAKIQFCHAFPESLV